MYVPRVRSGFELPRGLITGFAALCAVITAILAAAVFTHSTSDEGTVSIVSTAQLAAAPGSVVYTVSQGSFDVVYVRPVDGTSPPVRVHAFPVTFGLHARGSVSPSGNYLAALTVPAGIGAEAVLTLVGLADVSSRTVDGTFHYLSRIAWRPDGSALVLVRSSGRGFELVEVDVATLERRTLHTFDAAIAVAPLGYASDGRLLAVVVSQQGSSLWAHADGEVTLLSRFSPGLTSDWSLSPDASRLAFVDHLGAERRARAGRVLSLATGRVSDFAPSGEQLGTAWRPGAAAPDFGGPDGSVALAGADPGSYLVPLSWTPDGNYLIAVVVTPREGGEGIDEQIEILSAHGRVELASGQPSRFLGLMPGE